jgi:integrase
MEKAGVRQYSGARKGTHIFRHRLATALLEKGIPQPIISSTLGHTAPNSLETYLYADMAHLKECALDVTQYAIAEGVFSRA